MHRHYACRTRCNSHTANPAHVKLLLYYYSAGRFENRLAMAWNACTAEKPVFIEDESRSVGKIAIPVRTLDCMRALQ